MDDMSDNDVFTLNRNNFSISLPCFLSRLKKQKIDLYIVWTIFLKSVWFSGHGGIGSPVHTQ